MKRPPQNLGAPTNPGPIPPRESRGTTLTIHAPECDPAGRSRAAFAKEER